MLHNFAVFFMRVAHHRENQRKKDDSTVCVRCDAAENAGDCSFADRLALAREGDDLAAGLLCPRSVFGGGEAAYRATCAAQRGIPRANGQGGAAGCSGTGDQAVPWRVARIIQHDHFGGKPRLGEPVAFTECGFAGTVAACKGHPDRAGGWRGSEGRRG